MALIPPPKPRHPQPPNGFALNAQRNFTLKLVHPNPISQERFEDLAEYEKLKDSYVISLDTLKPAK